MLGRWGFTQIRPGSRKKKTIDGKRCNTDSTYNLVENTGSYRGFIETWKLVHPLHKTARLLAGVLAGVVYSGMQSYKGRGVSPSCHLLVYNLAAARPCQPLGGFGVRGRAW